MSYSEMQKRQHIIELQTYLKEVTAQNGIVPDGIYGEETEVAVREFQRSHGLPETGETDPETWDAIALEYRETAENTPLPCHVFQSKNHICRFGEDGMLVYVIQSMLNYLGVSCDNMGTADICGRYNDETAKSVGEFQQKCGLLQTGEVDVKTWNMLVKCCSHKF